MAAEARGLAAEGAVLGPLEVVRRLEVVVVRKVGLLTLVGGNLVGVLAFLVVFFPIMRLFVFSGAFSPSF